LIAIEKLGFDLLPKLRQLRGLPGHPDVSTPFIATNTGSLGMGISKAYGMARANRYTGRSGRIVVMTGDGELQEGQIWESLQPVANEKLAEITVIVDHNKFQSDTAVAAVSDLGPLEDKFRAFGWEVRRGDGHDFAVLRDTLAYFDTVKDKPKVFIADTIKGKGVSFMEGIACGDQTYHFHAGAPSLENYVKATRELIARINAKLDALGQPPATLTSAPLPVRIAPKNPEKIVLAYGDELLEMARHRPEIIVMDADLLSDCGIEAFKAELPDRFIECGIAEMHMVSAAGGMALRGMLPVVHSFACFLSTRANEHIYNNATEKKRIIYTATLAGRRARAVQDTRTSRCATSRQSARCPGLVAFEPCSEKGSAAGDRWAVEQNPESTYLRFVNVPLDLPYSMPAGLRAAGRQRRHAQTRHRRRHRRLRHGPADQRMEGRRRAREAGHLRGRDRSAVAQSHRR
jgi:transketolase